MQKTTSVLMAFEAYQAGKVVKHKNGEFLLLEAKREHLRESQNKIITKGERNQ